ncbi:MAG TPA: MotA/TolQ/ExbB proton channel family protein [Polyangia bacterium]|nr:MotA/TolQ/ExbB proton channel family protein [Polyangia bacterium]
MSFSPVELWSNMGVLARIVVILLLIMSIYSLWVMIDRFMVFSKAKRYSLAFVLALRDRLAKRDLNGAMKLAKAEPQSPIAKVISEALVEYRDGLDAIAQKGVDDLGEFDVVDAVNRAIDRVKEREVANLKKGLGGLASISSAAPFIGLFGTVVGIINAFRSMAASGQGGLGAVSAGIAEALFTTAVGLVVAIPAVMVFNYFTNSIESFVVDMNDVSSELISFVLREGRDRK